MLLRTAKKRATTSNVNITTSPKKDVHFTKEEEEVVEEEKGEERKKHVLKYLRHDATPGLFASLVRFRKFGIKLNHPF